MSRTSINKLLCGLALMIAMIAAGTGTASAQNCCTFSANVEYVPASCFRIKMTTSWGGVQTSHTLTGNAFYPNLSFLSASICPPPPPFDWVSLDGGLTRVALGQTRVVKANNSCCVTLSVSVDAAGCVFISINGFTSNPC